MADNNKIKKSAQDYYSNYYKNKPASPASSNNISQAAQNYYSSYYKNQQSGRSGYLSQNSNRYQARYNDMLQDPRKYYDAFGGNVTKYKSELSYYEFMTSLAQHDLPDQFIQSTLRYDDMRLNPQKYIKAYGGDERTYYSELNKYKELHGIEKTTASYVMSLMDKSGVPGWSSIVKNTPELLKFYDYDPTNPDDEYLRAVDYAPSSFLTAAQLDKKLRSGYSADYYTKFDDAMGEAVDNTTAPKVFKNTFKEITPTPSFYLSQLYKYDLNDPDDVINKALGLMPKSFKYDNTDDDIARKNKGLLPKYAEDYVKNSMRFNIEYSTYAQMMQQYANDLYEWKHGKNTGFLGIFKGEKPTMPEAPETVQAIMEYKDLLTAPTELQTPYEKYTEDATKAPDEPMFYFGDIDTLPLYVDEDMLDTNEPGYFQAEKDIARPGGIYEEIMSHQFDTGGIVGYIGKMVETGRLTQEQANELWKTNTGEAMARAAAEMVYENETIQELKDAGVYEDVLAESNRIYQDVQAALTGEYSPDKANTLKTNIDVVGQFIDMPVDWGGAIEYGTAGITNEIAAKLRELGWKGEKYSSNPEIQSLLDEAAYTAIKREYDYRQVTLDNMKNSPAWLIAIYDGMHSGVTNVRDNLLGLTLEIGKLNPFQPKESRSYLDKIAKGVAQSGQYRRAAYQEDLETAQGGATWGTNALFNITSTATELGLELAAGRWIGSYGASAATAAEAATRWRGLAKKLLFNKELVPYFMSSLGSSLMQGEIKGYNGLQNWLVALPTAYFEAKTESMFGFFSKSGSAYKLFKNGISSLPVETLKNFGRVLSENTLGETFEEVIQDVFGSTYEQIVTGQGDPINLGDTITTTLGAGVLMTLFGLPSGLKSYASARTVESSFNEAINAYESGDISAYNKAIEKMKPALGQALTNLTEDFRTGEIDRQAELLNIDEALSTNLNKMDSAIRDALNLRQLKEDGQDVPENLISLMDARVNNAIGTLKSMQGVETQPETLYDQIMNSEELVRMATGKGFTAELIGQSKAPLNNAQMQVLRDIEQVAEANPYINVRFDAETSVEELNKKVQSAEEKYSVSESKFKWYLETAKAELKHAYRTSVKEGQRMNEAIREELLEYDADVKRTYKKLSEARNVRDAFNAQGGFRKMFEQAANLGQGAQAPVSPVGGVTAADVQIPYETATTQGSPVAQAENQGVANIRESEAGQYTPESGDMLETKQYQGAESSKSIPMEAEGFSITEQPQTTEQTRQRLEQARTNITEYRKAVDALVAAKKIKVDTRDMSLTEIATTLENHAQYLEELAADAKDIKKPLISVKGLLPSEIESIGKALAEKKTAVANLRALAKDIRRRAEAEVTEAQNQLLKTLRKEARSSSIRRASAEYQNFINYYIDRIDLKAKSITAKKQGELEQLRAAYEGMEMPADIKARISRLDKMQISDMDIADVEELSNTIAAMRKIEMERIGEEQQITGQKIADSRRVSIENAPKIDKQQHGLPTGYLTWSPAIMGERQQSMKDDGFYTRAILPIQNGVMTQARNNMFMDKNVTAGLKPFIDKFGAEQNIKPREYNRLEKIYDSSLGLSLTEPELLGLYSNALDADLYEQIAQHGVYGLDFNKTLYEIERPQLREFINTFQDNYPELYKAYTHMRTALDYYQQPVNETFRHIKGYDLITQRMMNENPLYFPSYKDDYTVKEPTPENPAPDSLTYTFTKDRTGGGIVRLYNPMWVITKYTHEANNYVSYAAAIHDAHVILETPEIKKNMQSQARTGSGKYSIYDYWRKYLEDNVKGPQMDEFDGWVGKATGNYARAIITFQPFIALGQLASYPMAAAYINPMYLVNPLNVLAEPKSRIQQIASKLNTGQWDSEYMNYVYDVAPDMYDRIVHGQSMYEIAYLTARGKVFNGRLLREMDRIINLAWFDAAMQQTKAENPGLDKNSPEFKDKLGQLFHNALWNIQPMYGPAFRSPLQRTRYGNMFALFTAQTFQMQNQLRRGVMQIKNNQWGIGTRSILSVLASIALYAAIKNGTDKLRGKDTSFWAQLINATIGTVAPLLQKIQQGIVTITGDEAGLTAELGGYDITVPVADLLNDILKGSTKIGSNNYNAFGTIMEVAKPLAQGLGIPLKNIEEIVSLSIKAVDPTFDYGKLKKTEEGLKNYDKPSEKYDTLRRAVLSGNDDAAKEVVTEIIHKGGTLKRFLDAKTGGESFTPQQKAKITRLWRDAKLKVSMKD